MVSARVETNHIYAKGKQDKKNHENLCTSIIYVSLKVLEIKISDNNIRAKLISYEIVWATARIAPRREYFDLEAQPEPNIA